MLLSNLRVLSTRVVVKPVEKLQSKTIFQWLNIMFNQVDHKRRQELGADRTCAEWLLKNGAAVQFKGASTYLKDFNALPSEDIKVRVHKVDATDSSISHYGFQHFQGCESIQSVILDKCTYIQNEALLHLDLLKNSLDHLRVASCGNITEKGLIALKELKNLKTLELHNLQSVKNKDVVASLKEALPNCTITFD